MTLVSARELICGSAEINRMRGEIVLVTQMLFGLAKHPRSWIGAARLKGQWEYFHTRLGSLTTAPNCVWDVWWKDKQFQTRCLLSRDEDGSLLQAYISDSPPQDAVAAEDMGYAGIPEAHAELDVFVRGMLYEFPIQRLVEPFVKAARK